MNENIAITVVPHGFKLITPIKWIQAYPQFIERCGRTCYKSEDKITPDSAAKMIRALLKSGHHSVFEHASITVLIIGDRAMSHQLVRHRLAAYSQESQRYCDYSKPSSYKIKRSENNIDAGGFRVICPPVIGLECGTYLWDATLHAWKFKGKLLTGNLLNGRIWLDSIRRSYESYLELRQEDVKSEDARMVLPNATKTEVMTTYNLREWRHVFELRALDAAGHAQWEIGGIMRGILCKFNELLPDFFGDQFARLPWIVEQGPDMKSVIGPNEIECVRELLENQ